MGGTYRALKLCLAVAVVAGAATFAGRAVAQDLAAAAEAVLDTHCVRCHSPQSNNRSARGKVPDMLDTADLVRRGLIVPGNPDGSEVYALVRDDRMPEDILVFDGRVIGAAPVPDDEKEILRRWIAGLGG